MENILVLNNDYTPLNITDLKRAFNLIYKGKAEVVTFNGEKPIITELKNYVRPTIIRLLYYITIPFRKVTLNRENIFKRDDNECLYCGSKKNLTIDHVTPKSKGGKNTWQNLVTCCKRCNISKDSKTLKEANMKLKYNPYRPTYLQFIKNISIKDNSEWTDYLT
jgi:5-methylcytosine-specific restriction endonuclease McrA